MFPEKIAKTLVGKGFNLNSEIEEVPIVSREGSRDAGAVISKHPL
ncbi:hypothetical protein OSCI_1210006 [Kamptonema sp. PCC 6506]|nr:hypothetical protein OSCI_1210006 [Kamptonema sp. PCC 6506]